MIQKALVKKILDNTHAEIEVQRQSACGHDCASCGGCGAPQERIKAVAINKVQAEVGDIVTIEGENKQILRMAAIVFCVCYHCKPCRNERGYCNWYWLYRNCNRYCFFCAL